MAIQPLQVSLSNMYLERTLGKEVRVMAGGPAGSSGSNSASREPVILGQVIKTYLTSIAPPITSPSHYDAQVNRLQRLTAVFGGERIDVSGITSDVVQKWMATRLAAGLSSSTIYNHYSALRAAFRFAVKQGLVASLPFTVRPPKAKMYRGDVIPEDHMRDILTGLTAKSPLDRLILLIAVTGLRCGDALRVSSRDIDWSSGVLRLVTSKKKTRVDIPLPDAVLERLRPYSNLGPLCSVHKPKNISAMVRKRTKSLCGTPYGTHIFRHTLISALANAEVNPAVIQSIVGHTSPASTLGYTHPSQSAKKNGLSTLPWLKSPEAPP